MATKLQIYLDHQAQVQDDLRKIIDFLLKLFLEESTD